MLGEGKPTEVIATTIIEVTTEPGRVTRVADPSFARAPTGTVEPSEKVRVHPVIQSSTFGRSYSTIYTEKGSQYCQWQRLGRGRRLTEVML